MMIEEHARLEVKLPDGKTFQISEADIVNNSLSVSSRCVNGNAFTFGCVSPAQLSVRFRIRGANVSRYDIYGAEIVLYRWFGENPPPDGGKSGIFNVIGATKSHDIFTVSAADNICWLDGSAFGSDGESGKMGNAIYARLGKGTSHWCAIDAMGIIVEEIVGGLKFHPEETDKSVIPNAIGLFSGFGANEPEEGYSIRLVLVKDDEQSDNLRDYVAWLAAYMGGFVCADKDGVIEFRLFKTPYYQSPTVLQYSDFQADSLEIAGFRVFLYKNTVVTEDNSFYGVLTGKLPDAINVEIQEKQNPIIEYIYNYQKSVSGFDHIAGSLLLYQRNIQIRPFAGIYHGTQYLQLGQYIRLMDENGEQHDTVITNVEWRFRGGQKISCVGEDSRTLSEARKRTQAIRTGERLKTQLYRLEDRVTANNNQFGSDVAALGSRISAMDGRLNELAARVQALENGG